MKSYSKALKILKKSKIILNDEEVKSSKAIPLRASETELLSLNPVKKIESNCPFTGTFLECLKAVHFTVAAVGAVYNILGSESFMFDCCGFSVLVLFFSVEQPKKSKQIKNGKVK